MATSIEMDFVPHQEAIELKELDFDELCFGSWETDYVEIPTYTHSISQFYKNSNHPTGKVTAPTFSQAFRFFREKYRLYHNIGMIGYWDEPEFSYIISGTTMSNPAHMWHYEKVKFFEEAELTCLRKLIEIVKNETVLRTR